MPMTAITAIAITMAASVVMSGWVGGSVSGGWGSVGAGPTDTKVDATELP